MRNNPNHIILITLSLRDGNDSGLRCAAFSTTSLSAALADHYTNAVVEVSMVDLQPQSNHGLGSPFANLLFVVKNPEHIMPRCPQPVKLSNAFYSIQGSVV